MPVSGNAEVRARSVQADGVGAQHRPVGELVALSEVLEPVEIAVVVSREHQTALPDPRQQTAPGVQRGEQDVAELSGDLHELAELLDPDPEQLSALHGHAGKERPLPHQHAELTDEVAFLDHEDDAVVAAVEEKDSAREDEGQVVGVTSVPQQLAGLGMQHLAGRPQQVQDVLAEHRPGQTVDIVLPVRVDGPLVGHWGAAHTSRFPPVLHPRACS